MKKLLILALIFFISFPTILLAETGKATVFHPDTGNRKVVNIGDPYAFYGGYLLETSFGYKETEEGQFGYSVISNYKTTLSRSINSSASTIYVSSMSTNDGHTITMADLGSRVFLTLDPGRDKEEIVMCTGISGLSFTSCTRGLAFYGTSTAAVTANQESHNSGSTIVMSNVHYVYEQLVDTDTDSTITGDLTLTNLNVTNDINASGTITFYSLPIAVDTDPTADNELAPKKYVDDTVSAGSPDATWTVKGLLEFATEAEMEAGTPLGGTSAWLVPWNYYFNQYPQGDKDTVPVTVNKRISPLYIATSSDYTWTGSQTDTGSTTIADLDVTDTNAQMATTTTSGRFIQEKLPYDDSHVVNKEYADYKVRVIDISSTGISYTNNGNEVTVLSVTIPANTLSSTTAVRIQAGVYVYDSNAGNTTISVKYGGTTISALTGDMGQQLYTASTPFIAWIYPIGANAQAGNAMWTFNNSGQPNPIYADGTSAIDSTSAQTLLVTINGDGAGSDGGTVWWSVEALPYDY